MDFKRTDIAFGQTPAGTPTADASLVRLLAPGRIGPMALRNRMVMAPMGTGYATPDGFVSEQLIAYYAARAQGGAGLVMIEASGVDFPASMGRLNQPRSHDDRYIPGLARVAEAIHEGGARAAVQIFHAGRIAKSRQAGVQPVGPSAIAAPQGEVPRALSRAEIAAIVERFAAAARRVYAAGFDGVELHGAHGYLISNFLSAAANRREDEYGGDLAGRARFLLEVIRAVRAAVPRDFALWVRLNGEEPGLADGTTIGETVAVAAMAQAAGAEAIHVSAFGYGHPVLWGSTPREPGFLLPLAAQVKQAVGVPVIAVGRVEPAAGDAAISDGQADFIAFGRALIADPELPRKVGDGALDDIRPCLGCLKCLHGLHHDGAVVCSVNAQVGREAEVPPPMAARSRKVVVVGGGPAGMEAARVAARRGHRVVLFERESTLGGQLIPGARPPGKAEVAAFNRHLAGQLTKLGVTVKLGQSATAALVAAEQPEAVVVASGTVPLIPDLPGIAAGPVVTALEVLAGSVAVGERVVVIGGELVGCETAEFLAAAGKQVTVLRRGPALATRVTPRPRVALLDRLTAAGVRALTGVRYEQITAEGVVITHAHGARETIPADTIVLATGGTPERRLADELAGQVPEVHIAGDCAEPRSILEAVADGYRVGLQL